MRHIRGGFGLDWATLGIFLLIGILEIVSVWLVNRRLKFEHDFMVERGTAGEQLGVWLTTKESDEKDAPMMIDVLAARVGRTVFQTQKASDWQKMSVDSRLQNKYDDLVHEGIKKTMPPMHKVLYKVAEEFGLNLDEIIDRKELPAFLQSLENNGIGPNMLQNNGGGSIPQA